MPPRNKTAVPAKPKNTFATMKRIFSYMHGFRLQLVFVVIGIIASSSAGIVGNSLIKPLIDNLEDGLK